MDALLISFLIFGFMVIFNFIRKKTARVEKQVYRSELIQYDLDGKTYY